MEKAIFTIDGEIYVEGMHIPSNRWNGWAKPIFTLESAQVIATWLDDSGADFREAGIVVMIDGVPHWKELDESDGEVMTYPCVKCVVNGTEFYDIGAGGWVWDDVTIPDFGDDEESHDYWVGEVKACEYKSSGVMELVGK